MKLRKLFFYNQNTDRYQVSDSLITQLINRQTQIYLFIGVDNTKKV